MVLEKRVCFIVNLTQNYLQYISSNQLCKMDTQTRVNEVVLEVWLKVNQRLSEEVMKEVKGIITPQWFMVALIEKWNEYASKN